MNTRQRGKEWEQKVCRYLKDKGYFIVDVNFACACGEIDIIAAQRPNACFYRGEIPQKCPVRLCLRSGDTCKTEENPQDSGRLSCKTRTEYSVCRGRLPF